MNKKQRQVNQKLLDEEKEVIKRLRDCYDQAYKDVSKKILDLSDDPNMISHVHQKKYNQVLKKQIKKALDLLDSGKIDNIQDFLNKTAETSFIGTMYEFNEDIPFLLPMDNETIAKIINKKVGDFSFSERLHGDTSKLTDVTVSEIGRGFSTGMSFDQMALNIKNRFTHDMNNAFRIAQTEGHRVSQETAFDTAKRYKEQGADIVKQWDSTMDRKTRPHHVKLDGQIRELEDPFEVEGHKAMYPGGFGIASEDIRCRCVIVKRARWALEDDETKWDGDQDKLVTIKAKGYEEFKRKYESTIKQPYDDDFEIPFQKRKIKQKLDLLKVEEHSFSDGTYEGFNSITRKANVYGMRHGGKIFVPSDLNIDTQQIDLYDIASVIEEMPIETSNYIEVIEVVDYRNPQDIVIAKIYGKENFKSAAIGGARKITFFPSEKNRNIEQIKDIVYHESGHILEDEFFHDTNIQISDSKLYAEIMNKDEKVSGKKFVSKYSENNHSLREDLAESFKLYFLNEEHFRKTYPNRYELIKEWLKWLKKK